MTAAKARLAVFPAALMLMLFQLTTPAHAYVRAVTDFGVPLWWRSPCISMDIYLGSPPPTLTADQFWKASQLAAQAWSHGDIACTGVSISMNKKTESTAAVGLDLKNVIVFSQDAWCQQSTSPEPAAPTCYAANAMAVTTLFKNNTTGEIVDADMEINAVNFAWADLLVNPTLANGNTADFQNTLTHEHGHVIGLTHNCYSANDGPAPLMDNTGNPEMVCGSADVPASVIDATMYPVVATSDTDRRTLSPDDRQAACDLYPSSQSTCGAGSGQGCSVAGPTSGAPDRAWAVGFGFCLGLALAAIALRRSRSLG
jgi:hypothetical protein